MASEQTERDEAIKRAESAEAKLAELREALEEANSLNINWASVAEQEMLDHLSEYKEVIAMGNHALYAPNDPPKSSEEDGGREYYVDKHGAVWKERTSPQDIHVREVLPDPPVKAPITRPAAAEPMDYTGPTVAKPTELPPPPPRPGHKPNCVDLHGTVYGVPPLYEVMKRLEALEQLLPSKTQCDCDPVGPRTEAEAEFLRRIRPQPEGD